MSTTPRVPGDFVRISIEPMRVKGSLKIRRTLQMTSETSSLPSQAYCLCIYRPRFLALKELSSKEQLVTFFSRRLTTRDLQCDQQRFYFKSLMLINSPGETKRMIRDPISFHNFASTICALKIRYGLFGVEDNV